MLSVGIPELLRVKLGLHIIFAGLHSALFWLNAMLGVWGSGFPQGWLNGTCWLYGILAWSSLSIRFGGLWCSCPRLSLGKQGSCHKVLTESRFSSPESAKCRKSSLSNATVLPCQVMLQKAIWHFFLAIGYFWNRLPFHASNILHTVHAQCSHWGLLLQKSWATFILTMSKIQSRDPEQQGGKHGKRAEGIEFVAHMQRLNLFLSHWVCGAPNWEGLFLLMRLQMPASCQGGSHLEAHSQELQYQGHCCPSLVIHRVNSNSSSARYLWCWKDQKLTISTVQGEW